MFCNEAVGPVFANTMFREVGGLSRLTDLVHMLLEPLMAEWKTMSGNLYRIVNDHLNLVREKPGFLAIAGAFRFATLCKTAESTWVKLHSMLCGCMVLAFNLFADFSEAERFSVFNIGNLFFVVIESNSMYEQAILGFVFDLLLFQL